MDDTLPPFRYLISDEEREQKAKAYTPGTYYVIVNPDSFSGLPEYAGSITNSKVDNIQGDKQINIIETNDPNIVILRKFEDAPQRLSWQTSGLSETSEASTSTFPQLSLQNSVMDKLHKQQERMAIKGIKHAKLLAHFRNFVWKRLVQTGFPISHFHIPGAEIFEQEAATFRPVSPLHCTQNQRREETNAGRKNGPRF